MSIVEEKYQARIDAMSVAEKMQRSAAMLKWARDMMAHDIQASNPEMSQERVKWEVARRQYRAEPHVLELIEKVLERVPA